MGGASVSLRAISKLRFKQEPTGLRGVVQSGMLNANKDWTITLDDTTGLVYLQNRGRDLVLHVTDCAWLEFAPNVAAAAPKDTGVIITDAKAPPKK